MTDYKDGTVLKRKANGDLVLSDQVAAGEEVVQPDDHRPTVVDSRTVWADLPDRT